MASKARQAIVLFRVAAGRGVGFGHLVRSLALARALPFDCRFSVRGTVQAQAAARRLGARLATGAEPDAVLRSLAPVLLVIDDRVASRTAAWRRAARRAGIPLASIHDLGIGLGDADLIVDGSVRPPRGLKGARCLGPAFAVVRPLPRRARRTRGTRRPHAPRIVVALGGGPRRLLGSALARSIARKHPGARVEVAGGFLLPAPRGSGATRSDPARQRIRAVAPADFDAALAGADVAVVAGGMTLYEACSLGVPCVAVAVVESQRPTISGFAACGAALDGGLASGRNRLRTVQAITGAVGSLLADGSLRARLARHGCRLVDGRGAHRVAESLGALIAAGSQQGSRR